MMKMMMMMGKISKITKEELYKEWWICLLIGADISSKNNSNTIKNSNKCTIKTMNIKRKGKGKKKKKTKTIND